MKKCKNCTVDVVINFCPNCGGSIELKRIDGRYILHEIQHVLHFDKGFFNTVKELLLRPGENIKGFITQNRSRLIKPIVFIIITSLIYTIINHFSHVQGAYIKFEDGNGTYSNIIFNWIQNNYGYVNVIIGLFVSFWLKMFFRKYYYNFFEILILFYFIMGIGMLMFSFFTVFEGLTGLHVMQISAFLFLIYYTWAVSQFYDRYKVINYIKSFFAYILGTLSFFLLLVLFGTVLDFFTNT